MSKLKSGKCQHFLFQRLLPLWANHGIDKANGSSFEQLDAQTLEPLLIGRRRLLTQCRQLYTFSHACLTTENSQWQDLADKLFSFIQEHYWLQDKWIFSVDDEFKPNDTRCDAYALAFILLSFSFYYRLSGNREVLKSLKRTHELLQSSMKSEFGGFFEALPANDVIRRQNPHMHLLEGYLAAYQATSDPIYQQQSLELAHLALTKFFDKKTDTLREYFLEDWQFHPTQGHIVEAGHHFEWVWLLHQMHKVEPNSDYLLCAEALWRKGLKIGFDPEHGGIVNQCSADDGSILDREKRIWPVTEYLKAAVVHSDQAASHIDQGLSLLFDSYLNENGSWHEYLDEQNQPKSWPLPGTSSYHIFLGLIEVINHQSKLG